MKKNIGLFIGTFNPIHIGHLALGLSFLNEYTLLDEIWFVLKSSSAEKNKNNLDNIYKRSHLLSLAIENESRFKSKLSNVVAPISTGVLDIFIEIQKKWKDNQFHIVLSSKQLRPITQRKEYNELDSSTQLFVYHSSKDYEIDQQENHKFIINKGKVQSLDISSKSIREMLKQKKSVRFLVPDNIIDQI